MTAVAWDVAIHGIHGIAFAETAAKARYIMVRAYWDAYGRGEWPRPASRRRPEYDASPLVKHGRRAWTEDAVKQEQAADARR